MNTEISAVTIRIDDSQSAGPVNDCVWTLARAELSGILNAVSGSDFVLRTRSARWLSHVVSSRLTHFGRILLALLLGCQISGCGYMLGPQSVPGVRTVHVAVFQSESFRRNLDYLLTEAVQREVRNRGAYRLDDAETADTILRGRIVEIRKAPLSETRFDDPRELQLMVGAEVTWIDRRNGQILQQQTFPVGNALSQQVSSVSFAPEVGHSMATAQQEAASRLAAQIVDIMEMPW